MVVLLVKRGDENQFLYETDVNNEVDEVVNDIAAIFNGRLKVTRICYELEELQKHGTFLPPEMQGLNDDQVISYIPLTFYKYLDGPAVSAPSVRSRKLSNFGQSSYG
jgi:hypothetical protein